MRREKNRRDKIREINKTKRKEMKQDEKSPKEKRQQKS